MNKTGFFKDHQELRGVAHRDIWVISRLGVASAAALTFITFGAIFV